MNEQLHQEIIKTIDVLKSGGLILYPTDTIWGIGCDATNKNAIAKVYALKKRADTKALILLIGGWEMIADYVMKVPDEMITYSDKNRDKPTTMIFENAKQLPDNCIAADQTIAMRIPRDEFCIALLEQFKKPIVSTSANISGHPFSGNFNDIDQEINNGVDYIVQHRKLENTLVAPSRIIRIDTEGNIIVVRD